MVGFKKLHLSLMTILMTTSVVSSVQAFAPDKKVRCHGGWYIEVEGFNARSTDTWYSTTPIAFAEVDTFVPDVGTINEESGNLYFHQDPDWGYRVALGYDFPTCNPCCAYGYSLEYTYHNTDEHHHFGSFIDSDGFPALDEILGDFDVDATDVDAKYDIKYHTIDLLGHKNTTVCGCVDLQWFAGARYVRLDEDYDRHFFVADELLDTVIAEIIDDGGSFTPDFITKDHSKFNGIGPRVGVNVFYPICGSGFGLTTEVAGNLLFGWSESEYTESGSRLFEDDEALVTDTQTFRGDKPKHGHIVPGLSGKVGLAYRAVFCNCTQFTAEVGYRGDKYFGIADHSGFAGAGNFVGVSFNQNSVYRDYDLSGPYVSLTYHM